MSWYGLVSFCVIYFAAVATPGPGVAAVIAQGLARGSVGAPAFIAGFLAGDLIWFTGAALGLSALAQAAHTAFLLLKYAGAGYLLFLAFKFWSKPAQPLAQLDEVPLDKKPSKLFLGGLTLTLGNPKAMLFFVALLPTVVRLENLRPDGYLKIAAAIAIIMPCTLGAYVLAASRARKWFRSPRANKLLNRCSGTLMGAAAVAVAAR
ncbi:MAG TPA: LysE family translocator [Steroidobacteraceae bacterium]|nr:LysE family translocator [Steroidobacteraceae bacterium]